MLPMVEQLNRQDRQTDVLFKYESETEVFLKTQVCSVKSTEKAQAGHKSSGAQRGKFRHIHLL
jgi:hypothetical protein